MGQVVGVHMESNIDRQIKWIDNSQVSKRDAKIRASALKFAVALIEGKYYTRPADAINKALEMATELYDTPIEPKPES